MTLALPSVCPLDCPDTCSLSVTVKDGRITQVRGSDANPFTAGVICNKVARYYPDFVHGPRRLTRPLRRTGPRGTGAYESISWETALDLIHEGFTRAIAAHGPQSVLPLNYAGPHGELAGGSMDRRFFYRMGATMLDRGPLCGGVRGTAYTSLFGAAPGMPPEQAEQADLVLVWGNNVTVSNLHLMRVLKRVRAAGGRVVVIDPRRIKLAEQCDLHLQIKPGSDVVLAMALAAELERRGALDHAFIDAWVLGADQYLAAARGYDVQAVVQHCGLTPVAFHMLADWIAEARTMATSLGNGIERGRSGGAGLRAAMALNALTGQHGRPGAGVIAKPGLAFPRTSAKLQGDHLKQPGTRVVNIVDVAAHLLDETLDPPVQALMIYNHNPVATHPDQSSMIRALSRPDLFIAGADVTMTDSMAFCDVILPAASHFEFDDIYGAYGQTYLQRAEPVIAPVGESLPNTEIFRRLAARFGYDGPEFRDSDAALMDQAMDGTDPRLRGHAPSQLPIDRALEMTDPAGAPLVMCDTVVPATPSGRIELFSQDLEDRFGCGLPRHDPVAPDLPFTLITPSSSKRTNATFGSHADSLDPEMVEMHPEDAARLGLDDGVPVVLRNGRGAVELRVKITDATRPGVLYSPKGTWRESSATGQTVNALIPSDIRTDIERGACYNETFVEVSRA
ncbi:molybdopterin oxidoreductase family protein [Ruegeria pomeroyi]|uniref:Oxidoreductase, molybdopterin-binding protein n=2 Tax=Ruegeria pomeroyi TaxID=89184 RepID=Q5LNM0_RUEPO|nr:molybdopterin oxidoreductase family protein [Ruegeria pomeroyi]HCE71229.1 molybdopterin oxidoreductase family protein [Ruegeria sp.]AAV96418.1 oxidoreductase, molybdopterin-binding protein [Ruegeria pomeroyi DSS-3]NVK95651.1 molybdopterin oxidoreductase family protein [Ruegeria pomeroyi]NVL01313.1 molybdopterin oxidoreductase family protein [Ruegeria pomeroyi]QWV09965.1 molybdopterin oxidoreductase family protein [Ruegeria pomeroyi]